MPRRRKASAPPTWRVILILLIGVLVFLYQHGLLWPGACANPYAGARPTH